MRRVLTGYVVNFNNRHKRRGHLFQNRYKSIVCQEDRYLRELVRYIHLNLLRSGIVKDMRELNRCGWSGHSALVGKIDRKWQDLEYVKNLPLSGRQVDIATLAKWVCKKHEISLGELCSGSRRRVISEAKALWLDMLDRGVEIVKKTHFAWVWPTWLKVIPDFRDYKYIWMQRDTRDRAHSLLKYQTIQGYRDRSMDNCYKYCKAMDSAIRELICRTPNHLVVEFDDFVNLRKTGAISRFTGRELDTSLIDAAQVSFY